MKKVILPKGVDSAMGPYSPGLQVGDWLFVSGQGPIDFQTKKIVGETIEQQTRATLENVKAVVESAGYSMADCVKTTVHLGDIGDFDRFNKVYMEYFPQPRPTRTTVQSALWGGILVEIDAIAVKPS